MSVGGVKIDNRHTVGVAVNVKLRHVTQPFRRRLRRHFRRGIKGWVRLDKS